MRVCPVCSGMRWLPMRNGFGLSRPCDACRGVGRLPVRIVTKKPKGKGAALRRLRSGM
jgi:hypothetical protein